MDDRSPSPRLTHHWNVVVGGVIGLVYFAGSLGLVLANPTRYEWLLHGDRAVHHLGWHMYRSAPWAWPLGATPTLLWPVGSSVGLTDSLPILAISLKTFESLLPGDFQYVGIWLLASFVMQGIFGALLAELWTRRLVLQAMAAAMFVAAPPLLARLPHSALTAHWLLLAATWLYFVRPRATSMRWPWAALVIVAAATHPYLAFMVLLLVAAAHARDVLAEPRLVWRASVQAALLAALAGVVFWQAGYFVVGATQSLEVSGLGHFSMNLLAPIMPMEHSSFGPGPIPYATGGQYEGYAYLGAGVLLLLPVALARMVLALKNTSVMRLIPHIPLVLACVVLTLMAVSPVITAGEEIVAEYNPSWWGPLAVFRASGRMFWPVYYLLITLIVRAVLQLPFRVAVPLMMAGVVLQGADIATPYRRARGDRDFGYRYVLEDRFWNIVVPRHRALALVPTNLCARGALDPTEFLLVAGRYGVSVNSGLAARFDPADAEEYCRTLKTELQEGLRSDSLYVAAPRIRQAGGTGLHRDAICGRVDGFDVCVAAASYVRWQDDYDLARASLPAEDDLLDVYNAIDAEYRDRLDRQPAEAVGTRRQRLEALASYLSYRFFGCDHAEAVEMTRHRLARDGALRACAPFGPGESLPTPADTFDFRRRLEDIVGHASREATHVDREGEAVWIHRYIEQRLAGRRHDTARREVLRQLREIAP